MYLTFVYMKLGDILFCWPFLFVSASPTFITPHTKNAQDSFFTPITFTFYKEDTNS